MGECVCVCGYVCACVCVCVSGCACLRVCVQRPFSVGASPGGDPAVAEVCVCVRVCVCARVCVSACLRVCVSRPFSAAAATGAVSGAVSTGAVSEAAPPVVAFPPAGAMTSTRAPKARSSEDLASTCCSPCTNCCFSDTIEDLDTNVLSTRQYSEIAWLCSGKSQQKSARGSILK